MTDANGGDRPGQPTDVQARAAAALSMRRRANLARDHGGVDNLVRADVAELLGVEPGMIWIMALPQGGWGAWVQGAVLYADVDHGSGAIRLRWMNACVRCVAMVPTVVVAALADVGEQFERPAPAPGIDVAPEFHGAACTNPEFAAIPDEQVLYFIMNK